MLTSLYSYFSLSESSTPKGPSMEEQEFTRQAQACVRECHLKTLFEDSKFLREDSLQELVKVWKRLVVLSSGSDQGGMKALAFC